MSKETETVESEQNNIDAVDRARQAVCMDAKKFDFYPKNIGELLKDLAVLQWIKLSWTTLKTG